MSMNLVVLPIEGVSQTLLWQYREHMPILWQMALKSVYFRRFYTNSTSAFQSFCDFAYGDSSVLDHNLHYPENCGCLVEHSRNFFGIMKEQGYATMAVQHGASKPVYLKDNMLGAWPNDCGEFEWYSEYDPFFKAGLGFIESSHSIGQPFALYIADRAGTVEDNCVQKQNSVLFHERFEKGFSLLDGTVKKVLEKLSELGILDNTVILVYGPYGMDPWKHRLYGGRTHAMDPHADVCWTPMFLYNNGKDAKIVDSLACVIDLKPTLVELLLKNPPKITARTFSGINLLGQIRDVAFTQNMFALERENEGAALGLTKSYGVTDGDQRLIASSDGGILGEGGMELYFDPRDSSNTRNFLDFFALDDSGKMTSFGVDKAIHPHFQLTFRMDNPDLLIRSITESYDAMRDILRRLIVQKETDALEHCEHPREAKLFNEKLLNIKRKRE